MRYDPTENDTLINYFNSEHCKVEEDMEIVKSIRILVIK